MALMFKGISTVIDISPLIDDGTIEFDILNPEEHEKVEVDLSDYPTLRQQIKDATHLDKGLYVTDGKSFLFQASINKFSIYWRISYTYTFVKYDGGEVDSAESYFLDLIYNPSNDILSIGCDKYAL